MPMKPIIISCTTILLFCTAAFGQKWSAGIQAGANYSNYTAVLNSQPEYIAKYKSGFMFGANISYKLNGWLSLRAEVDFDKRNYFNKIKIGEKDGAAVYGELETGNHLSLPLVVQFELGKQTGFITQIGTTLNYLIGQGKSFKDLNIAREDTDIYRYNDIIFKTRMAIIAGIGLRIPINDKIGFMWLTRGFFDLGNDSTGDVIDKMSFAGTAGVQYFLN